MATPRTGLGSASSPGGGGAGPGAAGEPGASPRLGQALAEALAESGARTESSSDGGSQLGAASASALSGSGSEQGGQGRASKGAFEGASAAGTAKEAEDKAVTRVAGVEEGRAVSLVGLGSSTAADLSPAQAVGSQARTGTRTRTGSPVKIRVAPGRSTQPCGWVSGATAGASPVVPPGGQARLGTEIRSAVPSPAFRVSVPGQDVAGVRGTAVESNSGVASPAGAGMVLSATLSSLGGNPEERATRAALEKQEAEKRLREAERRLRAAVEELYNKHHKRQDRYSALFDARHPLCRHGDSCVANALGSLCQSFLLAYSVRVGVGVLLRAVKLLLRRRSITSVLDLQLLLSEKNLIVREEAVRNGLLFGCFSGAYHAIRCVLRRITDRDVPSHTFVAGAMSGLGLCAIDEPQKRRSLALYLAARLGQCLVNSPKSRASFLGRSISSWPHWSTFLFALASAQIMYAFVMRPETLPQSYFDFIVKTGPVPAPVLEAVRRSVRGLPVNAVPLSALMRKETSNRLRRGAAPPPRLPFASLPVGGSRGRVNLHPMGLGPHPPIIPCSLIHPREPSCWRNELLVLKDTFRKTFPLYLSLTFVPFVVLNLHKFMQSPLRTAWLASRSAVRSTSFLALFVGLFQAAICAHRHVALEDHKLVYWFSGAIAGLSALVEKPSRRTELALYTLPRAADSLWYILVNVHLLPDIKYAEVALFCLCLGGVVYYHEHEPSSMAPFLRGIISRFLNATGSPSLLYPNTTSHDTTGNSGSSGTDSSTTGQEPTHLPPLISSRLAAQPQGEGAATSRILRGNSTSMGSGIPGASGPGQTADGGTSREEEGRGRPKGAQGSERAHMQGEGQSEAQDWQLTAQRLEAAFQGL